MSFMLKLESVIKDSFPLCAIYTTRHGDYPAHSHDFQELVVTISGEGVHKLGSESYKISVGDCFVIAEGAVHSYCETKSLSLMTVPFDFKALKLPLQDLRTLPGFLALFELEPNLRATHKFMSRLRLDPHDLKRVETLLFQLRDELESRAPGYKALCAGSFLELVATLSRCQSLGVSSERQELWRLGELLKWLETSCPPGTTLDMLAQRAGMSKRNFQRLFKAAVGESPVRHFNGLRLEKAAAELAASPQLKLGEIALKHGFCDSNYFSKCFIKAYGCSPGKYRRKHLETTLSETFRIV